MSTHQRFVRGPSTLLSLDAGRVWSVPRETGAAEREKRRVGQLEEVIEVGSAALLPAFVDLAVALRFPARADDELPAALRVRAIRGGFAALHVAPLGILRADALSASAFARHLDSARRADPRTRTRDIELHMAPPPLADEQIGEIATMMSDNAGVQALRCTVPFDNALLLRRACDVARAHDVVLMLSSVDAALARGAVAIESAISTRLALPVIPEAAEAIGVQRAIELARLSGTRVHLTHLFTARGAALVEAARGDGLSISGSVAITQLVSDERAHLEAPYDTTLRVWPPLPTPASREALVAAVQRGVLAVSSGHAFVPQRERDLEFVHATPGADTLARTAQLLAPLCDDARLATALAKEPARILGMKEPLSHGAPGHVVLLDRKSGSLQLFIEGERMDAT